MSQKAKKLVVILAISMLMTKNQETELKRVSYI